MNVAGLPTDFAPYHVVRTDLPCAQGAGRFYKIELALGTLDYLRDFVPEGAWVLLCDGGVIDDTDLPRTPGVLSPTDFDRYLKGMTTMPRAKKHKSHLRILKKAA